MLFLKGSLALFHPPRLDIHERKHVFQSQPGVSVVSPERWLELAAEAAAGRSASARSRNHTYAQLGRGVAWFHRPSGWELASSMPTSRKEMSR